MRINQPAVPKHRLSFLQQMHDKLAYLRLKPFDVSTDTGRSNERYRRAALTVVMGALAKAVTLATLLISVPLTIHYLGSERYALWMTISSTVTMLAFADLGIGNGILNVVSANTGREDDLASHAAVSSGIVMVSLLAGVGLLIFAAAYPFVPWARIFNVSSPVAVAESGPAMAVFFVCWALSLPLLIVQRVQLACQEGFITFLWQSGGTLLGLAAIVVAVDLRAGLPWLVLGMLGGPVISAAFNTIHYFGWSRPDFHPRWSLVSISVCRTLLNLGAAFFIIQACLAISNSSDNLIAAQILGPVQVAQFSVAMRMFIAVPTILYLVLLPLWPAYSESLARGDYGWAYATFKRSIIASGGLVLLLGAIMTIFGAKILHLWVGQAYQPPSTMVLTGMAVWMLVSVLGTTVSIFLNGAHLLRVQAYAAAALAASSLILRIYLTRYAGQTGLIWGANLSWILAAIIPAAIFLPRWIRKMNSDNETAARRLRLTPVQTRGIDSYDQDN